MTRSRVDLQFGIYAKPADWQGAIPSEVWRNIRLLSFGSVGIAQNEGAFSQQAANVLEFSLVENGR